MLFRSIISHLFNSFSRQRIPVFLFGKIILPERKMIMEKPDYRKGLDKFVSKNVTTEDNDTAELDRLMSIPAKDLFNNKTEWVKEHEV